MQRAVLLALALVAASPLLLGWSLGRQEDAVEGEYGLHVRVTHDSLVVLWLTADSTAGEVEASWQGAQPVRVSTPPGRAHRAALARPRRDDVLLRYGAAGRRLYETRISLAQPRRDPVDTHGVDSLYVVGDVHGHFDAIIRNLRSAHLIDDALRWTGGRKHVVFAGDLTDRGQDVTRLLWLVYGLERQAARAGGRVHVVLGNHEIMDLQGDLRYLHPKEAALADRYGLPYDRLFDIRESLLGRWLASKPGLIRIDRALIAHGGVVPEYARLTLGGFDKVMARYMAPALFYTLNDTTAAAGPDSLAYFARYDFFWHPRSVFWYRGYVQTDSAGADLDASLRLLGGDVLLVGHTPVPRMEVRYGGRLIAVHTPEYGGELLLLVRSRRGYQRFRITPGAPPEPF